MWLWTYYNFSSRCMHFRETCPSIVCTYSAPNVTHTLVKFELKFYAQMDYTPCVISFPMAKANELNLVGIEIESPTMIGLKCLA